MTADIAGNYRILEKLGEGGMGEVFKGLDLSLEREVAIKALRPGLTHDPELLERFRKEAVALARLNHPNIATLYSFVSHGEGYYMVMEFAPGKTLDRVIAEYGAGLPGSGRYCSSVRPCRPSSMRIIKGSFIETSNRPI